ncbi:MAG TPA: GAF domain-containing protein [Thermomicrobiales bacterium]|nr:GAF domain-containing protein [Thermomicrobiales bacterium]
MTSRSLDFASTGSRTVTLLRTLNSIGRLSSTAASEVAIAEFVTTSVVDVVGGDGCAVFINQPGTDRLQIRAALGFATEKINEIHLSIGEGIAGKAASDRETILAPDARNHPNFLAVPGSGEERFRSEIATPMVTTDTNEMIGVLCLFSVKQRSFDDETVEFLEAIAREAAHAIVAARMRSASEEQLRKKVAELSTLQRVSRMIASSLDLDEVLRSIATASVEIIDAEAAAVFRLPPPTVADPEEPSLVMDYRVGEIRPLVDPSSRTRLVMQVIRSGAARITELDYIGGSNLLFCMPLRSARGTMGALCIRLRPGIELAEDELGLLQAFTDTASLAIENAQLYEEARASVQKSSTLLQEMHHRVRNNLQTVAALLSLQLRETQSSETTDALREAVSRVQSIAAVHDLLSDEGRLAGATVGAIARLVVEQASMTFIHPPLRVTFTIEPSNLVVSSRQATVLALLINELVANAVEHGFRDRPTGHIWIRAETKGHMCTLDVENDGEPLPPTFDVAEAKGLGMRIVERLVTSDLGGQFVMAGTDTGTRVRLSFPITTNDALSDLSPTR